MLESCKHSGTASQRMLSANGCQHQVSSANWSDQNQRFAAWFLDAWLTCAFSLYAVIALTVWQQVACSIWQGLIHWSRSRKLDSKRSNAQRLQYFSLDHNSLVSNDLVTGLIEGAPGLRTVSLANAGSDSALTEQGLQALSQLRQLQHVWKPCDAKNGQPNCSWTSAISQQPRIEFSLNSSAALNCSPCWCAAACSSTTREFRRWWNAPRSSWSI